MRDKNEKDTSYKGEIKQCLICKKDFTISNDHFRLADAVKEIDKCILICSNCHKEFHDNMWSLDELELEKRKEEVNLETDK